MKKILVIILTISIMLALAPMYASASEDDEVIGTAEALIRCSGDMGTEDYGSQYTETGLGALCADALHFEGETDIAVLFGGDLVQNIQPGAVTKAAIRAVFTENRQLAKAEITASELWEMLEYGFSYIKLGADEKTDLAASVFAGFPQVAGLEVKYDVSAPEGKRIEYILLYDKPLRRTDSQTTLTVCAPAALFEGTYGYPKAAYESLEVGQADALEDYVRLKGTVSAPDDASERLKTIGSYDKPLISRATIFIIAFVGCIAAFSLSKIKKTYNDHVKKNVLEDSH